jgi:hypothetical protein
MRRTGRGALPSSFFSRVERFMLFTSKHRSSDNRQRRLRSTHPQLELLENRLQPSAALLGQELELLTSGLAPLDPAWLKPANEHLHFSPTTGVEHPMSSPNADAAVPAAGGGTTSHIALAQPAMPVQASRFDGQESAPAGGNAQMAHGVAGKALAPSTVSVSPTTVSRALGGYQLTELHVPVRLISQVSGLSPAPTHVPAQQTFGGYASQDWATYVTNTATIATGQAIAVDANGNVYVTGATDEGTTKQAFVAAYDSTGNQLFLTKFQAVDVGANGTPVVHYSHSEGLGIALDGNGNIYVTGQATNPNTRLQDAFVMRLSNSGQVDATYGVGFDTGGLGNVNGTGIAVTQDGTATIVGSARFVGNDVFMAQIGANGVVNYGNAFPPADFPIGPYQAVTGSGVALSLDGTMAYIAGTGTRSDGTTDITVILIDTATGSQAGVSAATNPGGTGGGIVVGADGTVYEAATVSISANGQTATYAGALSWKPDLTTTNYEEYDAGQTEATPSLTGTGIAVDPTGYVYVTGTASDGLGGIRALVDRFDTQGAVADNTLQIAENGSGNEAGWGIAYSPDGTVYVTGDTSSSNLSTDGTTLNGQQDAFVANVGSFLT